MRKSAVFALALCAMLFTIPSAHAQLATSRLVGQWKIDKEKSIAAMKRQGSKNLDEEVFDLEISFQFQQKGRFEVISVGEVINRGNWRALREIANKGKLPLLEIEIKPDDIEDNGKLIVKYLSKNRLEITLVEVVTKNKVVLVFNRSGVKPKK